MNLDQNSLEVLTESLVEPSVGGAVAGTMVQFLRLGYFCVDPDSTKEKLVFNRTMTLKDTWEKLQKK